MRRSALLTLGALAAAVLTLLPLAGPAQAADKDNQVFFRFAYARLNDSRGGEVFADAGGASTLNDNEGGGSIGAGLDLSLMQVGENTVLGEIFLNYSRFSDKRVTTATSALLGSPASAKVSVSELNVTVAPKLRIDSLGPIRPWVIPVGLAFLVNSPPSNNSSYLDVGLHFGLGAEYVLMDQIAIGADFRYTHGLEHSDTHTRYFSTGGYLGINFE